MPGPAHEFPYSRSDRIFFGIRSALTAALLTTIIAAIANWGYERFFAPEQYAAGLPLARALFVIVLTFPFTLGGLLALGIPSVILLRKFRIANGLTVATAGVLTGVLWGATIVAMFRPTFGVTPHIIDAAFGAVSMLFWWWMARKVLVAS